MSLPYFCMHADSAWYYTDRSLSIRRSIDIPSTPRCAQVAFMPTLICQLSYSPMRVAQNATSNNACWFRLFITEEGLRRTNDDRTLRGRDDSFTMSRALACSIHTLAVLRLDISGYSISFVGTERVQERGHSGSSTAAQCSRGIRWYPRRGGRGDQHRLVATVYSYLTINEWSRLWYFAAVG
ncbi:hypothetical protein BDY19DRAFT_129347 [Irpex rosettiformis]|uniref:Uncharacterized protein n=1 Tax=Irpex rosettiformis TaxID=378272 RepID=A0ACB8U4L8_9APHY|nr:hypothetical protein BDY19DRAFT_129347 [Irpex rosettiformis]